PASPSAHAPTSGCLQPPIGVNPFAAGPTFADCPFWPNFLPCGPDKTDGYLVFDLRPRMDKAQRSALLEAAGKGITTYLDGARKEGRIDQTLYEIASKNVLPNLTTWLEDPHIDRISPR